MTSEFGASKKAEAQITHLTKKKSGDLCKGQKSQRRNGVTLTKINLKHLYDTFMYR